MIGDYWTKYKLERITAHLPHFTREMDEQGFDTLYVDAFAGDGIVDLPKAKALKKGFFKGLKVETMVPGSAARALDVVPAFGRYLFNDSDPANVQKLKALRNQSPFADRAFVRCRDANDFVLDVCAKKDWKTTRAVFVIDPYATQFRWTSLEAIAETSAADVWYLYPISAVVRQLRKTGIDNDSRRQTLQRVLGIEDIDGEFYRTWIERNWFGETERTTRTKDMNGLVRFVADRFRTIFPFVPWPKWVTNRAGAPMFLLFFASSIPGERQTTEFVSTIMNYPFDAPLRPSMRP